jgi:hypothetical protein
MNKLFPETEKWMNSFFINPETKKIKKGLLDSYDKLHKTLTGTLLSEKETDAYFLFLNNVLSPFKNNTLEEKKYKNETKEYFCNFVPMLVMNIYEYCALLAIIKTILDAPEKNESNNFQKLITEALGKIAPEIYTTELKYYEEYSGAKIEKKYHPEYFSYDIVMNDVLINNLIEQYRADHKLNELIELALNKKYSFLLHNEYFKEFCYINACEANLFELLPAQIKSNINYIKLLLEKNGKLLALLTDEQKDDIELVSVAIGSKAMSIQFASENIKNNKILMKLALEKNGNALEYASDEIKNDAEFVMFAVKQNYNAIKYASDKLLDNKEFIKLCMLVNVHTLRFASERLKKDTELIMSAIVSDQNAYKFIDQEILTQNISICESILRANGNALRIMPPEVRSDKKLVSIAVKSSSVLNIKYASMEIREDFEFMSQITGINASLFFYCGDNLKNNESFAYRNMIANPLIYNFLPVAFKNNEKFRSIYLHSKISEKMWDDFRKSQSSENENDAFDIFNDGDDDLPF